MTDISETEDKAVEFGQRLREIRKRRGLEQAVLSEIARVPTTSISHFERGKRKPNYDTLIRLAVGLGVSLDYLVGRTDYPFVYERGASEPPPLPLLPKQVQAIEDYIGWLKITGRYSENWAPVVGDKEPD